MGKKSKDHKKQSTGSSGEAEAAKPFSFEKSQAAFEQAEAVMPGGVSSPVRAFKAVGQTPVFVQSGNGPCVTDLDGNTYVDYVMSYGPLILGHAPEQVTAALSKTLRHGASFGMCIPAEARLAGRVIDAVPSVEKVRFVNSGTEACMSAIRLARAATGRDKVIKCTGCYHGHVDALLVEAGSGAATLGTPSSPGVPQAITDTTVLVPYNDLDAVAAAMEQFAGEVAVMAVEPVAGNMGCVPPAEGYLQGLRELCDKHDVLLMFDEVMSGFRVALGGAQERYDVTPDLTCLGKIIGGGLPCAAYGGPAKLMDQVAPQGPVYQAGTLSGNPLAMAAGAATLEAIAEDGVYEKLEHTASLLELGLRNEADKFENLGVQFNRVGSMLSVFFSDKPVHNFDDAKACRLDRFAAFFQTMLKNGIMLPPSQFEAWFVSTAHSDTQVSQTLQAAAKAFEAAAKVD